ALQRAAQEVLLPGDAPEVGGRVLLPVAAARRVLVLVVAGAGGGGGGGALARVAAGGGGVEARVGVAGPGGGRGAGAADGVDERLERAEVELDVVVDADPEVLVDRVDQALRVVAAVGRVDPALAPGAGDVDVEVAGERQHGDAVGGGVDPEHHDRVAA